MGIYARPQRTRHRENGAAHALEAQEQVTRQTRLGSMLLDRTKHLLSLSLLRVGTKTSDKMQPLAGADSLPLDLIFPSLNFLGMDTCTIPSHVRQNCTMPASNSSKSDGEHNTIKQRRMHLPGKKRRH